MDNKIKNNLRRIFAIISLVLFMILFVILMYGAFTKKEGLVMAMLFSIIFVSIVFYISKWFLNIFIKNNK